jgi:hypothetical protein
MFAADSLAANTCILFNGVGTSGQVLTDSGSTATTSQGISCRVMSWATPSSSSTFVDYQKVTSGVVGNGSYQTIYTSTIPQNVPAAGHCLHIEFGLRANPNADGWSNIRVSFGGTTKVVGSPGVTTDVSGRIRVLICNDPGVANAQQIMAGIEHIQSGGAIITGFNFATAAIDTAAGTTTLLIESQAAGAGTTVTGQWLSVTKD